MKSFKIFLVCSILTFSNQVSIAMIPERKVILQILETHTTLTNVEELEKLLKEEAKELLQARIEFIKCLLNNKSEPKTSAFGCPKACHDAAFVLALLANEDELNQIIKSIE